MTTGHPDFAVLGVGLIYATVCTSLSDKETTTRLNAECPTGITSRWDISPEAAFSDGQANPCPCEQSPATHRHLLFDC